MAVVTVSEAKLPKQVAGGRRGWLLAGVFESVLVSVLNAVIDSVIHSAKDASLTGSAEDEAEEGQDQDDDDDQATAVGPAAIDATLPLLAKGGFLIHGRRVGWAGRAGHVLYTIVI